MCCSIKSYHIQYLKKKQKSHIRTISDIQDYFKYILKHEEYKNKNICNSIRIYINKIGNRRIMFKLKQDIL